MRTEAEIKEALELIKSETHLTDPLCIMARDSTIEAFRYCLGIDNCDTSPMSDTLANLLKCIKEIQEETITE